MLEARVKQAVVLKKLLDAIKELVSDGNLDCTEEGISLQAMDNSHIALVALRLEASEFDEYRCDRNMPLGVNLASLTKILKCAKDTDVVTLKASDDADALNLIFESPKEDRVGEYEMKLMDIDQEHLGIPDTQYDATVSMSSAEFARICRDLAVLGESVKIECSKEGVTFSADGEVGKGSVLLRQNAGQDRSRVKDEDEVDEDEKLDIKPKTKREARRDPDEDDEDGQRSDVDVKPDIEGEDELQDEEEQEEGEERPKKRKAGGKKDKANKRAKKEDVEEPGVSIILERQVSLTFSLKYLTNFAKSAPLAREVTLHMSNDVPLLVQFEFEQGTLQFFLAPKIADE
ncbi:proliferating cell nuclear antigen (pcna) [Cryptococcus neoformans]|nr:proliferating cell nuclear antigen (pcna) [Cryptococcus neoformans var. grubii Th84]OXH01288.1 proliferating cell nuclear antigen (pcna) [Cryptococcus neoformans var. grubii]OXH23397.1 proliferating cell nuclear antigen (pcna) [Cryptococcus neoformans var. grubii]OXH43165.1 proliferating cell nuclear antigen (pcna) [Cryptococcus neoformans var. grubii]OXH44043.1 proliferating cell nuclear antigen (pcna) [Cryptococcus neoformans var. grubii]